MAESSDFSTEYTEYTNESEYSDYYRSSDSNTSSHTDGHKNKICFAVLVHNRKDIIIDLLDNIRCYCPNSSIVLYNGGDDPELCHGLGYPVCPTSRKLKYGITAIYMLEVMKWLEDINNKYDYLINLDSDVLFTKEGYETYIIKEMENKDYLGVGTKIPDDDFYCLLQLRHEKHMWKPLLGEEPYLESFNVGQVFSRRLVRRFLSNDKYRLFNQNLLDTRAFGVDELVFVTMADRLAIQVHSYQDEVASSIRYRPHFPLDEVIHCLNQNPQSYLLHPIYRRMKDESRIAIREFMKRDIQLDPDMRQVFINKDLGQLPYMIRRSKYNDTTTEWISASESGGLLYWKVRDNVLYGPYAFGSGKVQGISALESSFGNIEVLCRINNYLVHYWRNDDTGEWIESASFADGVTGMPSILESSYGNFEIVAPLANGGLGHWWRNNEDPSRTWFGPTQFGTDHYNDSLLIENNSGQLTAIAQLGDKYNYFVRDDRSSWQWFGPYE
ncbi:hypothetical protein [Paenibacillus bouchesdurhonensis]|uniref:hypothetical protein n=1 Tax=Paenibacillus bouchesdurhonensis TaxID=1870990 RepID=UPI000DA5FD1F|nr:hypothetical protein [Paenibacillus bouchesdurhonensis]